jgi:hypothetical protein
MSGLASLALVLRMIYWRAIALIALIWLLVIFT